MNISKLFLLTIVLFVSQLAVAQDADRNDSPYFQVVGDSTASFPLLSRNGESVEDQGTAVIIYDLDQLTGTPKIKKIEVNM